MQVTFHRALMNWRISSKGAYIAEIPVGYPRPNVWRTAACTASHPENSGLVEHTEGSELKILAGNGLKWEIIHDFIDQTGVSEVHFGSAVGMADQG